MLFRSDGDIVRLDADAGTLTTTAELGGRACVEADLSGNEAGIGRELFQTFRASVGPASEGGSIFFGGVAG